jgi:hypothetical protein
MHAQYTLRNLLLVIFENKQSLEKSNNHYFLIFLKPVTTLILILCINTFILIL